MQRNGKNSVPLFVQVYDKLLDMIKTETFKPGDKLPAENQLAQQLGVSRSTLRQALLLLQEDGLVFNYKGKGNFVTKSQTTMESGLERVSNAGVTLLQQDLDNIEVNASYQNPSKMLQEMLKIDEFSLIVMINCLYEQKGQPVGMMTMYIPYDKLREAKVNLEDKDKIIRFIDEYINNQVSSIKTNINIVTVQQTEWLARLNLDEGDIIVVLEEIMLSDLGEHVIFSKTFMRPESYKLHLVRRK